ncbi:hypothetical protein BsIDN1_13330 [Bacillus safensis]|uniref:Major facilitator superfamily (MFS) profile domain-containing protein n=1 Tax=Bacillus safensis TaxID=561879 RepID=A0A5S9M4I5_BACIA|nr:hypothetical protein BsIDN1_13330 [Bacillus safensis]
MRMSGMRLIAEMEESSQGHYTGIYNGLYRLGSLFGMLFGGIFASLMGFQSMTLVFGLLTLLGVIFYVFWMRLKREKRGRCIKSSNRGGLHGML